MNLDVSSHLHGHTVVKDHATFAAHLPRFAARFRANGSHPALAADAEHARLLGKVLPVVVVTVGRQPSGAAEAPAVRRARQRINPL